MGEGFNLRRDVHMRAANLVLSLRTNTKYDWVLVLPPWPHLYHWKSSVPQNWMPWGQFFDVDSLNEYVPSIELETYIQREGLVVDQVNDYYYCYYYYYYYYYRNIRHQLHLLEVNIF